ncbi:MAG: AraC family transcriptional regulator [Lachnospiraceae bacterium]|nr:AraC family transcriptional regulator [Lachnospiraceae bacterium]
MKHTNHTTHPHHTDPSAADKRGYLTGDFRLFHLTDVGKQEFSFHYHDFDKIIIFLSGSVTYLIEGRSYELQPYDIVLVNHNEIHKPLIDMTVPYERIIVYLSPDFLSAYQTDSYDLADCFTRARSTQSHVLRMKNPSSRSLFATIKQLESSCTQHGYAEELYRQVLFLEFLIQLCRTAQHQKLDFPDAPHADGRILDIMDYIKEHLADALDVDQIAAQFHFSRYHLMRLFKQETGCTLGRYITSKRLLAARGLLESDLALTEICYRCGFQNYSTFSRAYRIEFGECPRDTRISGK